MVLQMPCPDKQFVFVASSLEDLQQAENEIVTWASSHGYRLPAATQIFTLYSAETTTREWHLLERSLV